MPEYTYPFIVFQYEDDTKDHLSHPYAPLRIVNPDNGESLGIIWGLIDTGADATLFPASLAESLGHDLKGDGVKSKLNMGIEQKFIQVYSHTFKIELLAPDHKKPVWTSKDIEIECSETEPPVLIGVMNFLEHFKLTVDNPNQEFTLKW